MRKKGTITTFVLLFLTFLLGCENLLTKKLYEKVKIDVYGNSIIIPILINGKTYNFQLDTGAPTSISEELFTILGLPVKDTLSAFDYYGNHKLLRSSIISEIQIGNAKFPKIKASIFRPIQSLKICDVHIDGYLGSDFFADKILLIDIMKKEIILTNRPKRLNLDKKFATAINFWGEQKTPELQIYFTSKNAGEYVWFDTGSTNYLYRLKSNIFNEMHKDSIITDDDIIYTHENMGRGFFGPQNDSVNYVVSYDSIKICSTYILNCSATTFSSPYGKSILGAPLLQKGIVTIDYIDGYLYFNPYSETPINYEPKHGIFTNFKDDKLYIEYVKPGSIGDLNGIKKGYVLKKLNSVVFDSLSTCELLNLNLSSEKNKQVIEYVFEYENREIPVTIIN